MHMQSSQLICQSFYIHHCTKQSAFHVSPESLCLDKWAENKQMTSPCSPAGSVLWKGVCTAHWVLIACCCKACENVQHVKNISWILSTGLAVPSALNRMSASLKDGGIWEERRCDLELLRMWFLWIKRKRHWPSGLQCFWGDFGLLLCHDLL